MTHQGKGPSGSPSSSFALGPNQERWLKALESGEWEQCNGVLHRTKPEGGYKKGFCCLGVACELFKTPAIKSYVEPQSSREIYDGQANWAPGYVIAALGLFSTEGNPSSDIEYRGWDSLAALNDADRSFQQIADVVRADPGMYFREPR